MEYIRSFIAINLPEQVKEALLKLQKQLQSGNFSSVKWVNPSGIHLTLKFLGDVSTDKIEAITKAMAEAAKGVPPFQLNIANLGVFPNLRRVQVVWVGINGELDKLKQLQQQLELNLIDLGFEPESRPFTPHLTLARVGNRTSPDEQQRLGQLIARTEFKIDQTIKVDSLNLIRSQLTRSGAIYSLIKSVKLQS